MDNVNLIKDEKERHKAVYTSLISEHAITLKLNY